jgi:hypothetical protein
MTSGLIFIILVPSFEPRGKAWFYYLHLSELGQGWDRLLPGTEKGGGSARLEWFGKELAKAWTFVK